MDVRDELIEHVPRLRRYARALINNRDLADDLVQDTIMHNVFANQARKASARAVHVAVDDDSIAESELAVSSEQTRSLEMRDLDYALQRLPMEQREVVLLVGLEEMSYADVALALNIPLGTVMSRLSRGRERLRALMAGTRPGAKLQVVR
jgi:RNA polymerase sigma-70 factor (ECF subfamily)